MAEATVPALRAPAPQRDNPLTRSLAGVIGMLFLGTMLLACLGSLPYTLGRVAVPGSDSAASGSPRYDLQIRSARHLPPWWVGHQPEADAGNPDSVQARLDATARHLALQRGGSQDPDSLSESQIAAARPRYWMGTDLLGRSLLIRCLTGGGISLFIGISAALLSVMLGTLYGAIAGYSGGRVDAVMMRIVDILYGLPYILLVVLLAVASESVIDEYISRERARARWMQRAEAQLQREAGPVTAGAAAMLERAPDPASTALRRIVGEAHQRGWSAGSADSPESAIRAWAATGRTVGELLDSAARAVVPPRQVSATTRTVLDLCVLFVAIGGVSWLTMARVIRGQVLSLKAQPFMEAARAMGVPLRSQFFRHLLPNLAGPITVYATLTIPQAILQESFLSFLGIGVRPPLPSWGNLAAEGLVELNPYQSRWWLLLFPCLLLGATLLALNFVGEGLREALDPKRARR